MADLQASLMVKKQMKCGVEKIKREVSFGVFIVNLFPLYTFF